MSLPGLVPSGLYSRHSRCWCGTQVVLTWDTAWALSWERLDLDSGHWVVLTWDTGLAVTRDHLVFDSGDQVDLDLGHWVGFELGAGGP